MFTNFKAVFGSKESSSPPALKIVPYSDSDHYYLSAKLCSRLSESKNACQKQAGQEVSLRGRVDTES